MSTDAEINTSTEAAKPVDTTRADVVPMPRHGDRDSDPVETVKSFVKEHPYITIAGGLALGAIAASFLPKGTGRRVVRRAVGLAEAASAASLLLGKAAGAKASHAGHEIAEYGSAAGDQLGRLGGKAADRMHDLIDTAGAVASSAGSRIASKASDIKARVRS